MRTCQRRPRPCCCHCPVETAQTAATQTLHNCLTVSVASFLLPSPLYTPLSSPATLRKPLIVYYDFCFCLLLVLFFLWRVVVVVFVVFFAQLSYKLSIAVGANWQSFRSLSLPLSINFVFAIPPTHSRWVFRVSLPSVCRTQRHRDQETKTKRQRLMKMASHSHSPFLHPPSLSNFHSHSHSAFGFGCGFVARTNIFNKLRVAVTKCALIGKSAVENCQKRRAESSLGPATGREGVVKRGKVLEWKGKIQYFRDSAACCQLVVVASWQTHKFHGDSRGSAHLEAPWESEREWERDR